MDFIVSDILKKTGLSQAECTALGGEDGIQYLRFYHAKNWGQSSIAFIGFVDDELNDLLEIASTNNLKVYKKNYTNLSFVCLSDITSRSPKQKTANLLTVSKSDFKLLFELDYKLLTNTLLYDDAIPIEFRIAKPLSNFDNEILVHSFSSKSDKRYSVNLFLMTCDCTEFISEKKDMYNRGDLRRMCKHLVYAYKNNFGVYRVSALANCVFQEGYALLPKFHYFKLSNSSFDSIVNFSDNAGWWDLYIPNTAGSYKKYGYLPTEKRFSYNSKPIGIIPELRDNLSNFEKSLSYHTNPQTIIKSIRIGCLVLIIMTLLIVLAAFFLI